MLATPGQRAILRLAIAVALARESVLYAADSPVDLTQLSLEDLERIEVTSVSKTPEPRSEAAAAIAVITNEDVRRSGATSIPEALRMAPGLHVSQVDPDQWEVSSRGFSSVNSAKLLVLMDGRSLYTPLFSGVFWDAQDMFLEDLDRIEVIRGPGGTLWGANAMNGVINITTKSARDTQGMLLEGGGGNAERGFGGFRYGGQVGDDLYYRIYGKYFDRAGGFNLSGRSDDSEHMGRVGFRSDWNATSDDGVTLQGDLYDGTAGQVAPSIMLNGADGTMPPPPRGHDTDLSGGNVLGRWKHALATDSDATLQVYYDRTERRDPSFHDFLDTFDLDLQHRAPLPFAQEILWGFNYRVMSDEFRSSVVALVPSRSNDQLVSGFVQDEISLLDHALRLTLGTKVEHNDFSGFELQPSGRVAWSPNAGQTVWGAVSRAVRTPTRIERDLVARVDDATDNVSVRVLGNHDLEAEELLAYELGYRMQVTPKVHVDVAAFYNDYDRLVTQEIGSPFPQDDRVILPVQNGNKMHGNAYGGEVAVDWTPLKAWRLAASYSALQLDLRADRDSTDRTSQIFGNTSPKNQFQLQSFLDLPGGFELDPWLRWVDDLPEDPTRSYFSLDVHLGWRRGGVELAVVGQNLLQNHHSEFSGGTEVERGVYGKVTWRYGS